MRISIVLFLLSFVNLVSAATTTNWGCPTDFNESMATVSFTNVLMLTTNTSPATNTVGLFRPPDTNNPPQPILFYNRFFHWANSNVTYEIQYNRTNHWYAYVRYTLTNQAAWIMTDRPIYACEASNVLLRVVSN